MLHNLSIGVTMMRLLFIFLHKMSLSLRKVHILIRISSVATVNTFSHKCL